MASTFHEAIVHVALNLELSYQSLPHAHQGKHKAGVTNVVASGLTCSTGTTASHPAAREWLTHSQSMGSFFQSCTSKTFPFLAAQFQKYKGVQSSTVVKRQLLFASVALVATVYTVWRFCSCLSFSEGLLVQPQKCLWRTLKAKTKCLC